MVQDKLDKLHRAKARLVTHNRSAALPNWLDDFYRLKVTTHIIKKMSFHSLKLDKVLISKRPNYVKFMMRVLQIQTVIYTGSLPKFL